MGDCTMNNYELLYQMYGKALDLTPPFCGFRYSGLDISRIVAIHDVQDTDCGRCIEISSSSLDTVAKVYALVVDLKEAAGLDIAKSIYAQLVGDSNVLEPSYCTYKFVENEYCAGICQEEECSIPGIRNTEIFW